MITLKETPTRILARGDPDELQALAKHFRYHPKDYFRRDGYILFKATGGARGWDGYHYPFVSVRVQGEILRGRKDELLAACATLKIQVDPQSQWLDSPFTNVTLEDVAEDIVEASYPLDTKQREAIVQWAKHGMGIAHFSVNGGKTVTFAGAAAFIKRKFPQARFLYYTPAERLVRQTYAEMKKFLPGWDIGQYGGGKKQKDAADMVVCTQAMLAKHFDSLVVEKFFHTFHAVLVDESHHSQAPSAEASLRACGAYFRLAASASMKEPDPEKHNKIIGLCGPVRCTVTSGELIAVGRSAAPHIYLVDNPEWAGRFNDLDHDAELNSTAWTLVGSEWIKAQYKGPVPVVDHKGRPTFKNKSRFMVDHEYPSGHWKTERVPILKTGLHLLRLSDGTQIEADASTTLLYRRYDKAIMRFKERNELIKAWVDYFANQMQWPTLVVATRTAHVMILETLLREVAGDRVRCLIGQHTSKQKDVTLEWIKQPGRVLISSVIKEGVSINEIRAGIIADHVVDFEVFDQIVGRFLRRKEDSNVCHVAYFVDRQHSSYLRNCRALVKKMQAPERGLTFYWPVLGPDSIPQARVLGKNGHELSLADEHE